MCTRLWFSTRVLQTVRVDKLTNSSIVIELQSPVSFSDLNALSKRDLIVTLEAKQSSFKLQGVVVPRVSCDIYQTLVASNSHQAQDSSKKERCVVTREGVGTYMLCETREGEKCRE